MLSLLGGVLVLAAAMLPTVTATSATTIDTDRRTLAVAQSRPLLEHACINVSVLLAASPTRNGAGDASIGSFRAFILSKRSVNVRAWCLANVRNIVRWAQSSAYVADFEGLESATLSSGNLDDQLVGIRAAESDLSLRTGLLLARLAQPDRNRSVRIAALRHLHWPLTEHIRMGPVGNVYDRTIQRALHDRDHHVVVAGLLACTMLNQASADATLLAYARNRDPDIRAGVFEALNGRSVIDGTDSGLFALGLRDSEIRVRSAALIALRAPTRADLRLLAAFARNAPTREDRRNAREQLSAFRKWRPFF